MSAARSVARRAAVAGLTAALSPRPVADAVWGRDRLTVLAYHRIADVRDPAMEFDPGVVSATPEMFERQMRWLARRFDVIALDDLHEHLTTGRPLPARPALITFDDGYRDNHEAAFPVLRGLGLPAVIFLVTGAIGTDRVMWWDELASLLRRTERARAVLPLAGLRPLDGPGDREAARLEMLRLLKEVPDERREVAMGELREALDAPAPRPATPLFMDWDAVAELVAGGVDCQPHTVDHPLLVRVDEERARAEVARSAAEVAARTGRPARAFAYPNGDYDATTLTALRDAGITMAFTMRLGPCRADVARRAPLEIPRVPLEARDTWDMFRLKVTGGVAAVFAAGRRVRGRLPAARGAAG
ncbi:polysaccharide deacetylase family protein [Miltoncostaea marina]|uniref:polysaccharide deacetylase family protein n=1 Tax=Miltoncostaea marina TaxID=2843215 RepID=UPI001C3E2CD9|nr:polysaccharide deacetylase family protein [Miltoncostaea marina]